MEATKYEAIAIQAISNGTKFNGTVYGKKQGANDMVFSVYVDNKEYYIGRTRKSEGEAYKTQFLAMLAEAQSPKAEAAEPSKVETKDAPTQKQSENGNVYRDALAKHFSNTEDDFSAYARNESRGYGND